MTNILQAKIFKSTTEVFRTNQIIFAGMVAEEMKLRNAEIPYNLRDPLEILGERDFQPAKQIPEDVKVWMSALLCLDLLL